MKNKLYIIASIVVLILICTIGVVAVYLNVKDITTDSDVTQSSEATQEPVTSPEIIIPLESTEPSGVDLSQFYGQGSSELSDSVILMTDSRAVDFVIEKLLKENSYNSCKVLEQWHDDIINAECYYVLFSENYLYCIKEDSYGNVYHSLADYEYYLEVNCQ